MIQANELSIGNYANIGVDWGSVSEITGFRIDEIFLSDDKKYKCRMSNKEGNIEVDLTALIPIPLTEDILLKCGFEKRRNSYYLRVHDLKSLEYYVETMFDNSHFYVYISAVRHLPKGGEELKTEKHKLSIYNLHQLQNLYFALTGKELDVKL